MKHRVGYSATPLFKKLGLKPGMRIHLAHPPAAFVEYLKQQNLALQQYTLRARKLDYCHGFFTRQSDLLRMLERLQRSLAADGMLWLSWPKASAKLTTDLSGNRIRGLVLPTGLVDIKVCAVDEVWSGLKFVLRKELR